MMCTHRQRIILGTHIIMCGVCDVYDGPPLSACRRQVSSRNQRVVYADSLGCVVCGWGLLGLRSEWARLGPKWDPCFHPHRSTAPLACWIQDLPCVDNASVEDFSRLQIHVPEVMAPVTSLIVSNATASDTSTISWRAHHTSPTQSKAQSKYMYIHAHNALARTYTPPLTCAIWRRACGARDMVRKNE
jgi:hypothetical protein